MILEFRGTKILSSRWIVFESPQRFVYLFIEQQEANLRWSIEAAVLSSTEGSFSIKLPEISDQTRRMNGPSTKHLYSMREPTDALWIGRPRRGRQPPFVFHLGRDSLRKTTAGRDGSRPPSTHHQFRGRVLFPSDTSSKDLNLIFITAHTLPEGSILSQTARATCSTNLLNASSSTKAKYIKNR